MSTQIKDGGHTPGPWHWSNEFEASDGRKTWSLVSDANGYGILACDGEENAPQGINDHANARLIAASPRMYAYIEARAIAGDAEATTIIGQISNA